MSLSLCTTTSARAKLLDALGLAGDPDVATITRAYRTLALLHHPDRNPEDVENATERLKIINEAYECLISGVFGRRQL